VSAFFVVLVAALTLIFAIKYRRRHPDEVGADIHGSLVLELTWTFIPFVLSMVMFVWGADLFYRLARPPADSMDMFVVGKQWMWKVQHPAGVREINQMHVPIGRNVRIFLGSEDVLHDYSIPAFRVKMDAVPGKITTMWFKATQAGTYHIFCAEYCGHQAQRDDRRSDCDGAAGLRSLAPPAARIDRHRGGKRRAPCSARCRATPATSRDSTWPRPRRCTASFGSTVQLARRPQGLRRRDPTCVSRS
jgi:cytochrome c oxidase subunit II